MCGLRADGVLAVCERHSPRLSKPLGGTKCRVGPCVTVCGRQVPPRVSPVFSNHTEGASFSSAFGNTFSCPLDGGDYPFCS